MRHDPSRPAVAPADDQQALDAVVQLLDLEPIEVNIFRGVSPEDRMQRVFGGQVAGQALVAAARTVDDGSRVHSLHAYFLRPGDPKVPILYTVDRIRDGRSFTTRRVVAIQHGRAIFNLAASFQVDEDGYEHGLPMPDVPPPESLPDWQAQWASVADLAPDRFGRPRAIDLRYVTGAPPSRVGTSSTRQQVWLRAAGRLPDDPVLHTCLLTYASDMTLLDTALLPYGTSALDESIQMASLDHAMWFHQPFRADTWLLYDQETPAASGGRGLTRGSVFRRDGTLVASVVQEGLVRRRRR
ncbi:MAG TPA: acyl-CoA thioesterase II [Acidimicrobiales bacterium]|nr:acyl-CoA thioesterase II [Acidimicrobiales bacterium]